MNIRGVLPANQSHIPVRQAHARPLATISKRSLEIIQSNRRQPANRQTQIQLKRNQRLRHQHTRPTLQPLRSRRIPIRERDRHLIIRVNKQHAITKHKPNLSRTNKHSRRTNHRLLRQNNLTIRRPRSKRHRRLREHLQPNNILTKIGGRILQQRRDPLLLINRKDPIQPGLKILKRCECVHRYSLGSRQVGLHRRSAQNLRAVHVQTTDVVSELVLHTTSLGLLDLTDIRHRRGVEADSRRTVRRVGELRVLNDREAEETTEDTVTDGLVTHRVKAGQLRRRTEQQRRKLGRNRKDTVGRGNVRLHKVLTDRHNSRIRKVSGRDRPSTSRSAVRLKRRNNGRLSILSKRSTSITGDRLKRTSRLHPVNVINDERERLLLVDDQRLSRVRHLSRRDHTRSRSIVNDRRSRNSGDLHRVTSRKNTLVLVVQRRNQNVRGVETLKKSGIPHRRNEVGNSH
ncbi:hypothetical protein SAMN05428970_2014 [Agromyces sp. CF514]|nr:hypothetical protein SAMN05428970_2014 [Agromyces sp. CF514]